MYVTLCVDFLPDIWNDYRMINYLLVELKPYQMVAY